jgi:hypothetical protein
MSIAMLVCAVIIFGFLIAPRPVLRLKNGDVEVEAESFDDLKRLLRIGASER